MKICIVTDAWLPQVNVVVTTLVELQRGLLARDHEVVMIEPSGFRRFACPGYREIELAWRPGHLGQLNRVMSSDDRSPAVQGNVPLRAYETERAAREVIGRYITSHTRAGRTQAIKLEPLGVVYFASLRQKQPDPAAGQCQEAILTPAGGLAY